MPQFLILATDFTDDGASDRRLQVRNNHLERMKVQRQLGNFICGGAMLDDAGIMRGSMLVVVLDSIEEVLQWIAEDPYVLGNVWDGVSVKPFKMADV